MAGTRKPDNEVSEFALYYREYRKAKKEGKEFKRGAHRKSEDECSKDAHATYMREYMRRKNEKFREMQEKIKLLENTLSKLSDGNNIV